MIIQFKKLSHDLRRLHKIFGPGAISISRHDNILRVCLYFFEISFFKNKYYRIIDVSLPESVCWGWDISK